MWSSNIRDIKSVDTITVQRQAKSWALGCEKFPNGWLLLSKSGPPFSPSLYVLESGMVNRMVPRLCEFTPAAWGSGSTQPRVNFFYRRYLPAIPLLATRILVIVLLPPCDCENSSGVVVGAGGVPEGCRDFVSDCISSCQIWPIFISVKWPHQKDLP